MRAVVFAFALATLFAGASQPPWTLTLRSIGPVRIGSTIAEFRQAMGSDLAPGAIARDCGYAHTRDEQVYFYTRNGRIALASVYDSETIQTRSGIRVGSTLSDLARTYPGRLVNNGGGSNEGMADDIVYVPRDSRDQDYRIVFVVADGRVTGMAVGTLPDILDRGEASRCFEGG